MTDKKTTDSRRRLLKSIAAGSGAVIAGKSLPESWSKPVINSVLLPAHAESTTPEVTTTSDPCCLTDQTYCGAVPTLPNFEIRVSGADGTIEIEFPPSEPFGTGTTSEGCAGGTFTVQSTSNLAQSVSGSITCGATSIQCTFDEGSSSAPFTASIENCNQLSDIRLKTNIETLQTSREGYNLYKFQYLGDADKNMYVGVMAQEIMPRHPDAIVQNESGFFMVRYDVLGLKMVTLDEWELEGPDSVELKH